MQTIFSIVINILTICTNLLLFLKWRQKVAQYIKDEKIEKIIKETIIPDLEKLLSKEYQTDAEIIEALDKLESSWKNLDIPQEYNKSFDMLTCEKSSKDDIYNLFPYIHIYIYVMKLITYLFYNNSKFDTELSLLSSLNQICLDRAEDTKKAEYIMEHINYQQDIAMAKDEEKETLIKAAMAENAEAFKKICC